MTSLFLDKTEAFFYLSLAPLAAGFGAVCAKLAFIHPLF